MPATNGPVRLWYETHGPEDGRPLLLVQGFSAQLTGWREGFLDALAEVGFRIIIYDNRDVGLSQKFGGPEDIDGGYSVTDMAADGLSVLDALGIEQADVAGASMGGMIAQDIARLAPGRVRSLNLIYTSPSRQKKYFVEHDTVDPVMSGARLDRTAAIEGSVMRERISASTAYPFDEARIRERAALAYDRCYCPDGVLRQLAAIRRWHPDLSDLGRLAMPVSILHGRDDGHIGVNAAFDLGQMIPGSELHIYPGLGHELPEALWPEFARIIARTADRASVETVA